jgi:hypothetical protein
VIGFDLGSTGCQPVGPGSFAETGNSRRNFQSRACKDVSAGPGKGGFVGRDQQRRELIFINHVLWCLLIDEPLPKHATSAKR